MFIVAGRIKRHIKLKPRKFRNYRSLSDFYLVSELVGLFFARESSLRWQLY